VPKLSKVKVHYTGKLEDGTIFDSSVERGEPIEFTVGTGQVIKGWDEAIPQLRKGQFAILTIPPQMAYGEAGSGDAIPPNATLTFEVEIVDFEVDPAQKDKLVKEDYMLRDYYMPGYKSTKPKKDYPPHIRMFKDYIDTIGDFKKHGYEEVDYSPETDFAPDSDSFGPDSAGFAPDTQDFS